MPSTASATQSPSAPGVQGTVSNDGGVVPKRWPEDSLWPGAHPSRRLTHRSAVAKSDSGGLCPHEYDAWGKGASLEAVGWAVHPT